MTRVADKDLFGVDDLRAVLAELIEEDPSDIDPAANLFEQGLQSIALMRLVGRWRAAGFEIGFGELAESPTLDAWVRLLSRPGRGEPERAVARAPEAPGGEFDLAALQHAYWIGRDTNQRLPRISTWSSTATGWTRPGSRPRSTGWSAGTTCSASGSATTGARGSSRARRAVRCGCTTCAPRPAPRRANTCRGPARRCHTSCSTSPAARCSGPGE